MFLVILISIYTIVGVVLARVHVHAGDKYSVRFPLFVLLWLPLNLMRYYAEKKWYWFNNE